VILRELPAAGYTDGISVLRGARLGTVSRARPRSLVNADDSETYASGTVLH